MSGFISEGADEIYCGILGVSSHVHHAQNFGTVGEILAAIHLAKKAKKKFYFVANDSYDGAARATAEVISFLVRSGIDGVVVKDLHLMLRLKEKKIKTKYILSTLAGCLNIEAVRFYMDLGVRRVVLPVQTTPQEAAEVIRNKFGVETEIFLTSRQYCANFNGVCSLNFGSEDPFNCYCQESMRAADGSAFLMPHMSMAEHMQDLYEYHRLGVTALKVGRSQALWLSRIILKEALALTAMLKSGCSKDVFLRRAAVINSAFDKAHAALKDIVCQEGGS